MSAQPDIMPASFDHRDKVIEAQIARMEEDSHIIRGLRKQNERLKEEKLNVELEASLEIAKSKFAQAQMFQRLKAIEDHLDRLANFVQPLPSREEFDRVKESVSGLIAREVI